MVQAVEDPRRAFGAGRMTAQRASIVDAVARLSGAFTVDALVASAHAEDPAIGVATVYRAVSAMEASGWLERVGERSGRALFAHCSASGHHHHHVICTGCGRIELSECPLEPIVADEHTASGFVVTGHEVTLYGLCPECALQRKG